MCGEDGIVLLPFQFHSNRKTGGIFSANSRFQSKETSSTETSPGRHLVGGSGWLSPNDNHIIVTPVNIPNSGQIQLSIFLFLRNQHQVHNIQEGSPSEQEKYPTRFDIRGHGEHTADYCHGGNNLGQECQPGE